MNTRNSDTIGKKVKELFQPTKKKLLTSIIITLIWFSILWLFNWSANVLCESCSRRYEANNCIDYYSFLIRSIEYKCGHCNGACTLLSTVIFQYFQFVIIPFILIYLVYSIINYNRKYKR